jgi:WD40 repeat protein
MDTKSSKRQKSGTEVEQRSNAKPANDDDSVHKSTAINALLKMDCQAFTKDIRVAKYDILDALSLQISELQQALEAEQVSRSAKFSDVPVTVIVSNVFPYLENRTDWNNLSLVTKEINNVAINQKNHVPPWPEICHLWHGSLGNGRFPRFPCWSPNGECVAFCDNSQIHIWCQKKGLVKSWVGHALIRSLGFFQDGKLLLSSGYNGEVKYWDATNDYRCIEELTVELDADGSMNTVAFSPNRELIATGGSHDEAQTVCLWRVSDGSKVRDAIIDMDICSIKFSPDGKNVAVGGGLGVVNEHQTLGLWKLDDPEYSFINLDGHTQLVNDLAFSPDGKYLASASADKTIKLWDLSNRRCVKTFTGHTDGVTSISFSPCGNFLVSGSSVYRPSTNTCTGTFRTWNVATGACLHTMNAIGPVRSVEFSGDGRALLTEEWGRIRVRSTGEFGLGER